MATVTRLNDVMTDFNKRMRLMKEEMSKQFQNELKTIFKEVFETYPNVKKMAWTQYTPYFNDGDACIFSVYDIYVCDETCDPEDNFYDWLDISWGDGKNKYPMITEIQKMMSQSEDILLLLFGDHAKITVTPEGIDVEEYEHD